MDLICKCWEIIPDENIDYNNKCNEIWEDYYICQANCETCKKEYESSDRWECDNIEEAKENIKYVIEG